MNNASQLFVVFSRWFRNNFLALNDKKSYFMVFHSSHIKCVLPHKLNFDSYSIKRVAFTKYLGSLIDDKLSWHAHTDFVTNKVSKGLCILKICCKFLPRSCLISIYNACIQSYLFFGSELWGNANNLYLNPMLIKQIQCIRSIFGASKFVHCAPLAKTVPCLLLHDLYNFIVCLKFILLLLVMLLPICSLEFV